MKRVPIIRNPLLGPTHGTKATLLRPIAWLLGLLAGLLAADIRFQEPVWVAIVVSVLFAVGVLLYFSVFVYCLVTDRESLRTEKYAIQKLTIVKTGWRGQR